ncbi:hypothetical protein SteCoe_32348 [Stentor coeruleus]|uniref:AN1-type domain-containing protein n=1 Tax=Stentor coeruleus TaxID=5963 RepID=A0A1R2AZB2_9CILI|nr:hypothetical protein SteCoe_32348 [Stentor coeruleus]
MEAPICKNCKIFFGYQDGLCSKCFKESKTKQVVVNEVSNIISCIPNIVEEVKQTPQIRPNSDKCAFCNKKLGPLGFKCKCFSCFCTKHRHPEEHRCTYDHKAEGIRKISEENPLVQAPKFNKL